MTRGLLLFALMVIVASIFFVSQLARLQSATRALRIENERVVTALDAAREVGRLLTIVQRDAQAENREFFVAHTTAALQALVRRQEELLQQAELLEENERAGEMNTVVEQVLAGLQNLVNVTQGTINHAEDGNWPAVEFRIALLASGREQIQVSVNTLAEMTRERQQEAETQVNQIFQQTIVGLSLLTLAAFAIAGAVAFTTVRDVGRAMERLIGAAQRLAEGQFDRQVAVIRTDELGQLSSAFNAMTAQLQRQYSTLEQQVAERTAELQRRSVQMSAAATVAREAAGIRDVNKLLDEVVRLISERFGFYHAGIFLLDGEGYATLQSASSLGGQRMLARGHKLGVGQAGIVGHVAQTGQPRIALSTGEDAVFFDNPDLPDTESEMALPLTVRRQVIGVLDVQSRQPAAFDEQDVAILQTLADQVALAIESSRLLEESQKALQELEVLYGRRRQELGIRAPRKPSAYRYTPAGVESTSPTQVRKYQDSGNGIVVQERGEERILSAPITLRGEIFGTILLRQGTAEQPWTPAEIELIGEVCIQIGLALENARLLEETERRAEMEQQSGEMTSRIRETLDTETMLRVAVREIGEALNLHTMAIRLQPEAASPLPPPKGGKP
ncbi:MAG: GAF domain-containing protein [Anaerolineae bacterium]|nr:GAF domain-containing protein [Anaerolineae bacterium]